MPVAIPSHIWQECFVPGLQALQTAITLITNASSLESAQQAFGWVTSDAHSCVNGEGGCLDEDGECTWCPTDPLELCCAEELRQYAEDEPNSANQRKLLALASELETLEANVLELRPWIVRNMDLPAYKAEATIILNAIVTVLEQVYGVGRACKFKDS